MELHGTGQNWTLFGHLSAGSPRGGVTRKFAWPRDFLAVVKRPSRRLWRGGFRGGGFWESEGLLIFLSGFCSGVSEVFQEQAV